MLGAECWVLPGDGSARARSTQYSARAFVVICNKPFNNLLVKEDGTVYLCCYLAEPHLALGNLNVNTFDEVWNSEPARLLRTEMMEDVLPRACSHCPYYSQSTTVQNAIRDPKRWGGGEARIENVFITAGDRSACGRFTRGEDVFITLACRSWTRISHPVVGIALYHDSGRRLFGTNTALDGRDIQSLDGEGVVTIELPTDFLPPGHYAMDLAIHSPAQYHYDYLQCMHGFDIIPAPVDGVTVPEPRVLWQFAGGIGEGSRQER
ncbi:MAG: Wzt carbohydrate-binding domain-containing protein [Acidobacteria bacterium]|nr:Wzt carbohydrate-binding domain-containing protein [Acidobacteriota bacterium]